MAQNAHRDDTLKIRVDRPTFELMETARNYLHLDKSKFIRESIREKAEAVIAEHGRTRFTAEDWEGFFAAFDEPAKPTERMINAVKKYRDIIDGS
ncbi:ribbon-helix-helix domain-containing protein [Rhizobium etli bv. mimosae str. IE4771]|uniref:Ribbon-helix-helix domain-containing protein n=1 Tax=Rhizobium etli bv. mimosae str. IE4771 TaxID=1432050 RepID=A0A060I157_RHIET|nr:DUF1778 domain-containing protein [Rhizobium sp. IE4771]AIC27547.1 ribbon-helix-helix domain-containing protein [Rhizobium sp. IE4771]